MSLDNNRLKQFLLIGILIVLAVTVGFELYTFFPGLLGAVTLYILARKYFFHLTVIKNWKKWIAATVFLSIGVIIIALPFAFLIQVLIPKFTDLLSSGQLSAVLGTITRKLSNVSPYLKIDEEQIMGFAEKLTSSAPIVLGTTLNMLANTALAFFILYFMLVDGRKMEQTLQKYIPLKDNNIDDIWNATYVMVKANAIGIPMLAFAQAVVAAIGYKIFGINSYILWGVLTGVCSVIPIVGTMVIWVPLCIYLFATGNNAPGLGLVIYSLFLTGGVDNVLRFTILRRLGDVHPIITALGVIIGIPLFGFMGFIFGPLLISYLLLLVKIYRVEFTG